MNLRRTLLFFTIATVVSVALRLLIIFFTTDSASGFFMPEFSVISYGMLAIIIISAILCVAFSFKCKRPNAPAFWKYVIAAISILLGISIFIEALFFDSSANVAPWQNFMQTVFGILAAAVFVWYGGWVTGFLPTPDLFIIIPVIYYIFRLVVVFTNYASLATITDTAFELTCLCCILIFLMKLAKDTARVDNDNKKIGILPMGIFTAFVIFTQALPVTITLLSGNPALVHSRALFLPTCILMGQFVLFTCIFKLENISSGTLFYKPRHDNNAGLSIEDLFSKQDNE